MVKPVVIAHTLHGVYVARVADNADNIAPAARIRADRTGIGIGKIAADRAKMHLFFAVKDRYGELAHLILGQRQDMIRQTLRGFPADAGQF